jgi:response regulator RpfG family c-di-GMP phosphodiesterase
MNHNTPDSEVSLFDILPAGDPLSAAALATALPHPRVTADWLLDQRVLLPEEWDDLPAAERARLSAGSSDGLVAGLAGRGLLTPFQVDAIRRGSGAELVIGHYRLLDVLGQGGMGTVYRAEHLHLRRPVAIKVMTRSVGMNARLLRRFDAEARAVAKLRHPNIVTCFDAGRHAPGAGGPGRDYFVMELIPGKDLFALVRDGGGPLPPQRACDLFRQVADALAEAHRHGLIHRDVKPGNVLVTPDGQAKVLDFGLARVPDRNVTEPGTLLGTVGYMAPEQARDPHAIDSRADLFGLGATMYWALTGREPYPDTGNPLRDLSRRMTSTPPPVREVRADIPAAVSDLVARLMERDPDQRFPSARAAAAALAGFGLWLPPAPAADPAAAPARRPRVLLVDDDPLTVKLMTALLGDGHEVRAAGDGEEALAEITRDPPDLAVVDVNLPGLTGAEVVTRVRAGGLGSDRVSVLLTSGMLPEEALGGLALSGADDFLPKPFKTAEFASRVRALLARRAAGAAPAADSLAVTPGPTVRIPTAAVTRAAAAGPPARPAAAVEVLSLTAARLLVETGLAADGYWDRMTRYVRALAGAVADRGEYARLKDDAFLDLLAAAAPVHDLGLLAVPRGLLLKPGQLDPGEQEVLQTHTTVGSDVLQAVAGRLVAELPALPTAAEVVRSHHERWDGAGYPDALAGAEIPLAARVVAVAAVYEALRVRRPHRPAQSHAHAVKIITTESPGQFDPAVVTAFAAVANRFEQIHHGG